ncbi:MAG TPA: hypothetical protein VKW04_02405 [Planctomycetota bacterium]|nr:hypothetical protein [Planctomycetota bacterium]
MLKRRRSEQGSAMLIVTIILIILVGISGAYMTISWANKRRANLDVASTQALYIAEAGAAAYVSNLNSGVNPAPLAKQYLAGGYYWVPVENMVDFSNAAMVGTVNSTENAAGLSYVAFQVAGKYGGVTRRLDVIANHQAGGVFWNAIFAGNQGDPTRGGLKTPGYTLNLQGGTSASGSAVNDAVNGNVYSGGNVNITGQATMTGIGGVGTDTVTYNGTNSSSVTGPTYTPGQEPTLSIPRTYGPSQNMSEAQYKAGLYNGSRDSNGTAWVDVGAQFNSSAATPNHTWVDGTHATDITNVNNPAHIFRKNPSSQSGASNRTAAYEQTIDTTTVGPAGNTRNDYYMEDPTNSSVTNASLTGVPVNGDTTASMLHIAPSGNNAVYYVPGNLRVSGEPIKSYQLDPMSGTGSIKMTMVVQGNVSLTDNILYPNWESTTDSMAIIAIADPMYPNSVASDFAAGSGSVPLTPNGVSIDTFITQYNQRAANARNNGLIMPDLNLTVQSDWARASQEYNKIYGSGNVFFGDPGSGTVEHFEAFMYAENNFYATNLNSTNASGGTTKMEIWGNMTAGNQVSIDRTTSTGYIPLHVMFDPAIMGSNPPPGLPSTPQTSGQPWVIASWRQSANTAETTQQ